MQVREINEKITIPILNQFVKTPSNKSSFKDENVRHINNPKQDEIIQQQDYNQLNQVVEELNKHLNIFNARMSFFYDEEKKLTVVKIQDRETGEIIRQFPPDDMLKAISKISALVGIVVGAVLIVGNLAIGWFNGSILEVLCRWVFWIGVLAIPSAFAVFPFLPDWETVANYCWKRKRRDST